MKGRRGVRWTPTSLWLSSVAAILDLICWSVRSTDRVGVAMRLVSEICVSWSISEVGCGELGKHRKPRFKYCFDGHGLRNVLPSKKKQNAVHDVIWTIASRWPCDTLYVFLFELSGIS